jgi:hypothetical protein
MDQNVPEGDYLRPRDLWESARQLVGNPRRRLSNDRQLLHYGASNQLRLLEACEIRLLKKRSDVIGGGDSPGLDVMTDTEFPTGEFQGDFIVATDIHPVRT